tara:strand:- start:522 stop:680 length:159 start_codon:yes stop_codon:yes gene_type:complete
MLKVVASYVLAATVKHTHGGLNEGAKFYLGVLTNRVLLVRVCWHLLVVYNLS